MPRRIALACVALLSVALPSVAAADIPAPNDEHCDLALQQRDGSRCEACVVVMTDPTTRSACDALAAREGWSRRCSRGATVSTSLYCDREADFVRVGQGGSSGGCAIGAGTASPWLASLLLGLLIASRRRRIRSSTI
jgi:hypothetical protein